MPEIESGPDASSVRHVPILVEPIVAALVEPFRLLSPDSEPHWLVDCTLGGGGHTSALLTALNSAPALQRHKILAIDRDTDAVERARGRFEREIGEGRLELHHARFSELEPLLEGKSVLGLMADLGFSSDQMDDPERGLSFRSEGSLDMRLDRTRGETCLQYLQKVTEQELARIIFEYGDERFSRRIASVIVQSRRDRRLPRTARELSELVVSAMPPAVRHDRHGRIHPATRTFQALRIAVNQELDELDYLLGSVILSIKPGGRIAILSFHSLEDRRVKLAFRGEGVPFRALSKKPIEPDEDEIGRNPRARSAKLRIAERIS